MASFVGQNLLGCEKLFELFAFRATVSEPQLLTTCATSSLTLVTLPPSCSASVLSGEVGCSRCNPQHRPRSQQVHSADPLPVAGLDRGELRPPREMGHGTVEHESEK